MNFMPRLRSNKIENLIEKNSHENEKRSQKSYWSFRAICGSQKSHTKRTKKTYHIRWQPRKPPCIKTDSFVVCLICFPPLYKPATKSMNCSSDLMIFTPTLSPPFFPDVKACVWLEIFHSIPHIYFFYICEMLRFAWLDNYHTLFYYFSLFSLFFTPVEHIDC